MVVFLRSYLKFSGLLDRGKPSEKGRALNRKTNGPGTSPIPQLYLEIYIIIYNYISNVHFMIYLLNCIFKIYFS